MDFKLNLQTLTSGHKKKCSVNLYSNLCTKLVIIRKVRQYYPIIHLYENISRDKSGPHSACIKPVNSNDF